ncbi:MAG: MraY family glycosyltransferase [Candidatus Omnitrophota bacterium]
MTYLLIFITAVLTAFLLTPIIRSVALRFYIIDQKNRRKVHKKIITKLGGISIYLAFLLSMVLAFFMEHVLLSSAVYSFGIIFICGSVIFLLGIYDDIKGADAKVKFVTQIIVALLLIKSGFLLKELRTPFGIYDLGGFSVPVTLLWIVGITNAVNLIDGLDGLAVGIVSIIAFFFFLISLSLGDGFSSFAFVALFGAGLGFLRYNFYPAKIFMGDTGSMFIGLIAAVLTLRIVLNPGFSAGIVVPIIAFGLPIADTSLAVFRRLGRGQHVFTADDSHIHHWLLKKGFSHRRSVIIMYSVTILICFLAFFVSKL